MKFHNLPRGDYTVPKGNADMRVAVIFRYYDRNGVGQGTKAEEHGCATWKIEGGGALTLYTEEIAPVGMQLRPKISWPAGVWLTCERITTPPPEGEDK